jgi:hypothetical protein
VNGRVALFSTKDFKKENQIADQAQKIRYKLQIDEKSLNPQKGK